MYLSGSPKQGRWTVIEKGMPLCADTSTLENALLTFKRFAGGTPVEYWDWDSASFRPYPLGSLSVEVI